jgi:hypothetical protein
MSSFIYQVVINLILCLQEKSKCIYYKCCDEGSCFLDSFPCFLNSSHIRQLLSSLFKNMVLRHCFIYIYISHVKLKILCDLLKFKLEFCYFCNGKLSYI